MPRPGHMLLALGILALAACSGGGAGESNTGPAGRNGRTGGGPGQRSEQPPVPVAVEEAITGSITSTYAANATLEPDAQAAVLARVPGVVQTILVEEGARVEKGQALLQIEADEYRFRLQQAEASTKNLGARYERLKDMSARGLASAEEFDTAEAAFTSAEASEGLARIELGYTTVRAPMDGFIVNRLVDPGQPISANTEVFRIADFNPLLARVHVPSKEFRRLTTEQPVTVRLDSDGTVLIGHIQLVSPVIDPASGTIKVTVEIPEYPAGVRPGDFAQVRIVTEKRENRVLVPRVALVSDKGEDVVFVERGGIAERIAVEVGLSDDLQAEIVSGIAPGDRVVVKGQRSLQHGQSVRVLDDSTDASTSESEEEESGQGRKSS